MLIYCRECRRRIMVTPTSINQTGICTYCQEKTVRLPTKDEIALERKAKWWRDRALEYEDLLIRCITEVSRYLPGTSLKKTALDLDMEVR